MSGGARDAVWWNVPSTWSPATTLVALAMADVVNDMHGHRFWASVAKLAPKCGLAESSVRKAVATLESDGWLTVIERREGSSTVYRWTPPNLGGVPIPTPSEEQRTPPPTIGGVPLRGSVAINRSEPKGNRNRGGASSDALPKRGTRLPNPYPLTDAMIDAGDAIDDRLALALEHDKFCDYWWAKAGRDATKLDWVATWRNWCRNASARLPARVIDVPADGFGVTAVASTAARCPSCRMLINRDHTPARCAADTEMWEAQSA